MHQHGQHRELAAPVEDVLLGPGDALQHGVHGLEVARVGGHRGLDRRPAERAELSLGAQVVLDVAGALDRPRVDVALELAEDLGVALADDVGQHVQPAAVRHADADLDQAVVGRLLADLVQHHDRGLATLQREPLLADELGLQEGLEDLGLVELVQDPQVLLAGQRLVRPLHPVLDPLALRGLLDVHVLDADGATVGVAQDAEDLAHLHQTLAAGERAGGELAVQVPQSQAVGLHIEVVVAALPVLQRVGVGHQVTPDPVGVDHLEDAGLLGDLVLVVGADVLRPADRLVRDPQRRRRRRRRSRPRRAAGRAAGPGTDRTALPGSPGGRRSRSASSPWRRSSGTACPDRSPGTPAGSPSSRRR